MEKEYEEELQGKHTVREITVDKEGKVDSDKIIQKGSKGNNLKLTIDLDFKRELKISLANNYLQRFQRIKRPILKVCTQ